MRLWLLALLLLSLLSASGCGKEGPTLAGRTAQPSQPIVHLGVIKALGTVQPFIAENQGYYHKLGVRVAIKEFQDGPALMEAFASGNLDVAYAGIPPATIWASKGIPIKLVAAANGGGHAILVRGDSGINSLADLRGKHVATPNVGSGTDVMFRTILAAAGLDAARDMKLFPGMAPADMPVALFTSRSVDAIVTWQPYQANTLEQFKGAKVLVNLPDYWQQHYGHVYLVNGVEARVGFIKEHPDLLRKVLAAHVEATDFLQQQPEAANQVAAAVLKMTPALVRAARSNLTYQAYFTVDEALELPRLAVKLGYMKALPDPREFVDTRFLPKRGD